MSQPGFRIVIKLEGIQLDQVEEIITENNGFIADINTNGQHMLALLLFDTMDNARIFARRMSNAGLTHEPPRLMDTNISGGLPATGKDAKEFFKVLR